MSVFGGDSWAREAQHRKRRVDDVLMEGIEGSSYKKLPNGKYACLVCPHSPVLDTPLMLSMHSKGSRHIAATSRMKERELKRQDEMNKRLALSHSLVSSANSSFSNKKVRSGSKPLIEQTRKATSQIVCKETSQQQSSSNQYCDVKLSDKCSMIDKSSGAYFSNVGLSEGQFTKYSINSSNPASIASDKLLAPHQFDFRERRERELKFIEAGWKRDCHGRWYKDENVEFDSDDEDPNIVLGRMNQNSITEEYKPGSGMDEYQFGWTLTSRKTVQQHFRTLHEPSRMTSMLVQCSSAQRLRPDKIRPDPEEDPRRNTSY